MREEHVLKTNDDFNGNVANLIKIINACNKYGINLKDVINTLRTPDKKLVLNRINTLHGKTEEQKRLKEEEERAKRASAFGIGE